MRTRKLQSEGVLFEAAALWAKVEVEEDEKIWDYVRGMEWHNHPRTTRQDTRFTARCTIRAIVLTDPYQFSFIAALGSRYFHMEASNI